MSETTSNAIRVVRTPSYPTLRTSIPSGVLRVGRYLLRFAADEADLRLVQRLRFEVFNVELGEGLASAYERGLDEDAVDARCHHLMVVAADSNEVVGTYRLMTHAMSEVSGFYSSAEYDLSGLPIAVRRQSVELGRACVAPEHRNGRVVQLLWRGIARYLVWNDARYLFGCCSVPTLDVDVVRAMYRDLAARDALHPALVVSPRPAHACPQARDAERPGVPLPPLFASYLELGAKVLSGPALDPAFGVTDFFVLLDLQDLEPHVRRAFLARGGWDGARDMVIGTA